MEINSWQDFARLVRARKEMKLLAKLAHLTDPVLVSGCQRSGTTILANILTNSRHFVDYQVSADSELDGAQLLCGHKDLPQKGRYCLQTTYLNDRYPEYYEHLHKFKLIFVIRNPFSVVYSMCYHWGSRLRFTNFALNELFQACGAMEMLTSKEKFMLRLFGVYGVSVLRRACLSYVGKTSQLFDLKKKLGNDLLVIEYDDLVGKKSELLPRICAFINTPYADLDINSIHSRSVKRAVALSPRERRVIETTCTGLYEQVSKMAVKLN